MENRQRSIRKLLWRITAVLAILAVVSICFVSGTFARYVSNRNGSTVTDVAKWDIDFTDGTNAVVENNFTVTVGKLSPSMANFPTPENNTVENRVKSSGAVLVLKIENKGDVDATLTITPPEKNSLIFYGYGADGKVVETTDESWGSGFAIDKEDGKVTKPSPEEAREVITMQFALVPKNTDVADIKWSSLGQEGSNLGTSLTLKAKPESGETSVYYFYVRSVWTSRDQHYYQQNQQNQTTAEEMSDGLDTWLGENIAKLGGEFTFAAIQASEWPAEDNTP